MQVVKGQRAVSRGRVHDLILELQVGETDGMAEAASIEVQADHFVAGYVDVVIQRITVTEGCAQIVLEVGVARKEACALGELVIKTAEQVAFVEGIGEGSGILGEGRRYWHRNLGRLNGALVV